MSNRIPEDAPDDTPCVIWDTKVAAYWRSDAAGYTEDITQAGIYTYGDVKSRQKGFSCRTLLAFKAPPEEPKENEVPTPQFPDAHLANIINCVEASLLENQPVRAWNYMRSLREYAKEKGLIA